MNKEDLVYEMQDAQRILVRKINNYNTEVFKNAEVAIGEIKVNYDMGLFTQKEMAKRTYEI